jgi:hypothetical protein
MESAGRSHDEASPQVLFLDVVYILIYDHFQPIKLAQWSSGMILALGTVFQTVDL